MGIRVLSLFDGIGGARLALDSAGIPVSEYVSYEIDSEAQKVLVDNYPGVKIYGDVNSILEEHTKPRRFDLVVAGSPCQGFSNAGKGANFEDPRSALFYKFEEVVREINPEYFFLENVVMKKEWADHISEKLGVRPEKICSSEISQQRRNRLYWANFHFPQLKPIHLKVRDIIKPSKEENSTGWHKWWEENGRKRLSKSLCAILNRRDENQLAISQTARQYRNWSGNLTESSENEGRFRFLTPEDCEKLHDVPVGYTSYLKKSSRYKALGNGWANQVVGQLFKGINV